MTRGDKWSFAAFTFFVCVVFPFRALWDFNHPENWRPGSADDPHVYLWLWAGVGILILWVMIPIFTCERKKRERKAKLAQLYARAKQLLREKQLQEAESVIREFEQLAKKKYI
jgi:hypothetical protein